MKVINRSIASIVVGLSLAAGAVSEPSIQTIGGNLLVNRSFVDTYGSFFMDIHHPFEQKGTLTHWEIYAANTKPVQLVIYRQQNGAFLEVGRSAVVTPVVGYNLFQLSNEIKVEAGDFVGGNQPGASLGGAITFTLDGTETNPTCAPNLERTTLLSFGGSTDFTCSSNRTYSLRAFGRNAND